MAEYLKSGAARIQGVDQDCLKEALPPKKINVLAIEDDVTDQHLLNMHFSSFDSTHFELHLSSSIEEGRMALELRVFDIVLIDYRLPDGTGPEFIREVKDDHSIPFIVLTGYKDREIEREVLSSGASDFIPKNELNATLLERVLNFSLERSKAYNMLREQTLRDPLTGLYNRLGMEMLLDQEIAQYKKYEKPFALLLIDVDRFKTINDTYGHAVGDLILKVFSDCLAAMTRSSRGKDFPIRISGDEFALLATELEDVSNVRLIIERLTEDISGVFEINGYDISVSLSIGVAAYPQDGIDKDDLVGHAEFSLYQAKEETGTTFEFFDAGAHKQLQERNFIENSIKEAVRQQQFALEYQPKYSTKNKALTGFESLIRWNHPEKGTIWPREFIHITEKTGDILAIGDWVLKESCRQCVEWQKTLDRGISIAANISIRQLLHNSFYDRVCQILEETGLEPRYLELEITESLVIQNMKQSGQILKKLRRMGVSISLDDFGTGYSSLSRLRLLPIDTIKMDRSLIRKVGKNRFDTTIAYTVLSLAKNLNLKTVAEGVETLEQYRFLRNLGCPEVQGYFFSKPIPASQVTKDILDGALQINNRDSE